LSRLSIAVDSRPAVSTVDPDLRLPLCVDLDGTLIHGDSLHEALAVASRDLGGLARAVRLLRRGKAAFKRAVYEMAALDAEHLPYNRDLLDYLRSQHAQGRRLFLVTAADSRVAQAVADHLGLFEDVISSDGDRNLRGRAKADALAERFGERGFSYAGNDRADLAVWSRAGGTVLVSTSARVAATARRTTRVEAEFASPSRKIGGAVRALRVHQWAKNLLVFVPIVASTEFLDVAAWQRTSVLFFSFCFAASSVYIVNDLVDLSADRLHPRKRLRPFASGEASVRTGVLLSAFLAVLAIVLSAPVGGVVLVLAYAALSSSYSFVLKEKALVDVFVLAWLYTIRIFAGGVVSGHTVTEWLVGFSIFMFLSLALAKRVAELLGTQVRAGAAGELSRRAYTDKDLPILQTMGVVAAFLSALVLSLYLQSQAAEDLYVRPGWLLAVVVIVLFWLARVWLQTARGRMHDDPVVWAVKDRPSQLLAVGVLLAMFAAITPI
jgi:4-hydroxybenzoate polyprenyltransferase